MTDTGTPGCDFAYTGTDCGYNVDLSTGEMAHMNYSTLGNTGLFNTIGQPTGCSNTSPFCPMNTNPFSNLQSNIDWSGATTPVPVNAWLFRFSDGQQLTGSTSNPNYAWAVRPGTHEGRKARSIDAVARCVPAPEVLPSCEGWGVRCG